MDYIIPFIKCLFMHCFSKGHYYFTRGTLMFKEDFTLKQSE